MKFIHGYFQRGSHDGSSNVPLALAEQFNSQASHPPRVLLPFADNHLARELLHFTNPPSLPPRRSHARRNVIARVSTHGDDYRAIDKTRVHVFHQLGCTPNDEPSHFRVRSTYEEENQVTFQGEEEEEEAGKIRGKIAAGEMLGRVMKPCHRFSVLPAKTGRHPRDVASCTLRCLMRIR